MNVLKINDLLIERPNNKDFCPIMDICAWEKSQPKN